VPFPRSLLFVPAHQPRMLAHAWEAGAEALVLDLEDGVPAAEKAAARAAVAALVRPEGWTGRIFARVNAWNQPEFVEDARTVAGSRVDAVVLPKSERVNDVRAAATAMPGVPAIVLLIETALGVVRAAELAVSGIPTVQALAFGAEDYRASMDAGVSPDPALFDCARLTIAAAARAAGLAVIDAPELDVADLEALRSATTRARGMGFRAKFAIHPSQVPVIHEALGDPQAERAWAARVLEAYDRAAASGRGAAALDGRMIDRATVRRARAILDRSDG